jgi:hypothetical protein
MPVHAYWDDTEKTILVVSFEGRWTWDEYEQMRGTALAMMDSVDHPIDIVYDGPTRILAPPDFVTRIRQQYLTPHRNLRLRIFVGTDEYFQLLWNTFTDVAAPELGARFAETLEDARATIVRHREESGGT